MDNVKKLSYSGASSIIVGAFLEKNTSSSDYTAINFTTREPHKFYPGSLISIDSQAFIYGYSVPILDVDASRKTLSNTPYIGAARFKVNGKYKGLVKAGDTVLIAGVSGYNATYVVIWAGLSTVSGYYYFSVISSATTDPGTITGGGATILNKFLYNVSVFKVNSPTSFSVKTDRNITADGLRTSGGDLYTGGVGISALSPAIAYSVNAPSGLVNVNYAQPTY